MIESIDRGCGNSWIGLSAVRLMDAAPRNWLDGELWIVELYRWQLDCLKAWERNGFRGILHVITGAGKTVAALEGAKKLEQALQQQNPPVPLRLRIVAPTIAIARQWVQAVRASFPEAVFPAERKIGLWCGEQKDSTDCFCLIYVVHSARHSLSAQMIREMEQGYAVLLIADECHHYGSPENRKIFDFRTSPRFREDRCFTLGLSATPQCDHFEEELVPALGPVIYWYQLPQAIHEGTVSPFVIFQTQVSLTAKEAKKYNRLTIRIIRLYRALVRAYPWIGAGVPFSRLRALAEELDDPDSPVQQYLDLILLRRELCLRAENRLSCAVDLIRRQNPSDRIVLFCERIDQAEAVRALLRDALPSQTGMYHSEMLQEKRREVLRDFRDGVIRVLIACKALDEGVDVPDASIGIVLSSTQTDRQRIQRLGRILRRADGKRQAVLYYLHLGPAIDDADYLPGFIENLPVANLTYSAANHLFESPFYTAYARAALQKATQKGMDPAALAELRKRMDRGITQPEWLLPPEDIRIMLDETEDRNERNRLIAQQMIAQARLSIDSDGKGEHSASIRS